MANASSFSGDSSNNNDEIKNLNKSKEEEPEQSTNEMKKMIDDVKKELEDIRPSRSRYDIYHISGQLFNQNPDAYRPHMVSIGPLYPGDEHLRITETDKLQYLNDLIKRSGKTFEFCVNALNGLEEKARKCYSESDIKLGKVEFAGVKFQKRENASNLFDINFDKGVLAIPTIVLSDHTEVILRNFIAVEQEELGAPQYFTSYAAFMDDLIDTTEDVTLLTQNGIIINGLGSPKDAVTLFNKIVKQVVIWDTQLSGVTNDLNEHYNIS